MKFDNNLSVIPDSLKAWALHVLSRNGPNYGSNILRDVRKYRGRGFDQMGLPGAMRSLKKAKAIEPSVPGSVKNANYFVITDFGRTVEQQLQQRLPSAILRRHYKQLVVRFDRYITSKNYRLWDNATIICSILHPYCKLRDFEQEFKIIINQPDKGDDTFKTTVRSLSRKADDFVQTHHAELEEQFLKYLKQFTLDEMFQIADNVITLPTATDAVQLRDVINRYGIMDEMSPEFKQMLMRRILS